MGVTIISLDPFQLDNHCARQLRVVLETTIALAALILFNLNNLWLCDLIELQFEAYIHCFFSYKYLAAISCNLNTKHHMVIKLTSSIMNLQGRWEWLAKIIYILFC